MKAKTPPAGTVESWQFRNLQSHAGIKNQDLAKLAGISVAAISKYRCDKLYPPASLVTRLRKMGSKAKRDAKHLDLRITAYLKVFGIEHFPDLCHGAIATEVPLTEKITTRRLYPK